MWLSMTSSKLLESQKERNWKVRLGKIELYFKISVIRPRSSPAPSYLLHAPELALIICGKVCSCQDLTTGHCMCSTIMRRRLRVTTQNEHSPITLIHGMTLNTKKVWLWFVKKTIIWVQIWNKNSKNLTNAYHIKLLKSSSFHFFFTWIFKFIFWRPCGGEVLW